MASTVNLSLFFQESSGRVYDPLHGHSFHRTAPSALSAVQHSRLFFRDCLICQQRVLSLGKANARKRRIPENALHPLKKESQQPCLFPTAAAVAPSKGDIFKPTSAPRRRSGELALSTSADSEAICQCLDCGNFVHRECLSQVHAHRRCRGHGELLLRCPQTTTASTILNGAPSPVIKRMASVKRKYSTSMTISSLIDELSEDRVDRASPSKDKTKTKSKATTAMKRAAPFLAAGGVIGAIALGPAAGVIAGLNVLVAGVSMEGMAAGLGFTAATAAATASHQIKKKNEKKRQQEEMKSGAWAMQICWEVKQQFRDTPISDDIFRKDADFLRRFQLPRRSARAIDHARPAAQFAPTKEEVHALLFGILSTPSEFLSQVNAELGKAFLARYTARALRNETTLAKAVACKETLQDARMYVAHLVGAMMQTFPSMSSTDTAVVSCSQAIERVIFDDIYKPVIGVLDELFVDENVLFYASLEEIRRQQGSSPQLQLSSMVQHLDSNSNSTAPTLSVLTDEHLREAEQKLIEMMEVAKSPMHKLELLCAAFRALCCFADKLHQTAANADILIPIVCALLVASPQFSSDSSRPANFVSQIAFTSYFTNGGGKGVEGYVLTTFQAALQVIAAVDLSQGPAKELQFFANQQADSATEVLVSESRDRRTSSAATEDGDEFFDATEEPGDNGVSR